MAQPKSKTLTILICLGLALAVFGVFSPALKCDFVNYDDTAYITENPYVQHGITAESLKWAFTTGHASIWHPITWISHLIDVQLYGLNPAGHHLTSVLIHAANTVLMFLLLLRMTGAFWASAFIAAMFGLHPMRVESVAWACERKDVLSTFFWLLTATAYVRYVQTQKKRGNWFALALLFFALALMSKPMVVTLPFLLLLIDFWPLKRISPAEITWIRIKPLLFEKLPFITLALAASIVTLFAERAAMASFNNLTLSERIENAFVAYARYVAKTFWPTKLEVPYLSPSQWPLWQIIVSITLIVLITAIAIRQVRARPYLAVGWFWFLGTLVPAIGLVQAGPQAMADRFSYVPAVGLFIMITWAAVEFVRNRIAITGTAIVAVGICCILTPIQTGYWKNPKTLFTHAIDVDPRNYVAYDLLGLYASTKQSDMEQAIALYKKSIEIKPSYDDAHNNLGVALASTGDVDGAIHEYQMALNENPTDAGAHNNYGIALAMKGQLDEAIENFRIALRSNPDSASAHGDLGNAYAIQANNLLAQGKTAAAEAKFEAAISEFNESLNLNPDDPQGHYNLGNVLAQRERFDEAILEYRKAIQLKPENPETHFGLGFALEHQGKPAEAEAEYQIALSQKPDYTQASQQLQALRASRK